MEQNEKAYISPYNIREDKNFKREKLQMIEIKSLVVRVVRLFVLNKSENLQ